MRLELTLPWPPTVNTYWSQRVIKQKDTQRNIVLSFLSENAKKFRKDAEEIIGRIPPELRAISHGSPIRCHVLCFPPDSRRRDLDNLSKGLLDALKHTGVIRDDSDIWDLRLTRECMSRPPGNVVVRIWPFAIRQFENAA